MPAEAQIPKKRMIAITTPESDTPDYIIVKDEDENKNIGDLILDLAEEKQREGDGASAMTIRGSLENLKMYFKNAEINPQLRVKDLNFDVRVVNGEGVNFAAITLQEQHTGG